ncbi:uncharacterized protein LOC129605481 [Condylostylus longicornis]|uniref:uncharacterized protein LOC129605481 n=1 Tax=Condylostylus longicornis TaxID=2530218 RepID=UPI00244DC4AC|nr:uncharacterized protein LOC129605481 [Condylostylus longicornis]
MENREKESPARTIDSCGSTAASMETIVDRNIKQQQNNNTNHIQAQTAAMENSTNATNCNKNSLTNSQISMISNSNNNDDSICRNDSVQHHIYQSPDLVLGSEKKTIKKFREDIIPIKPLDEEGKRKLEMLKTAKKNATTINNSTNNINGNKNTSNIKKSSNSTLPHHKVKLVLPKREFPKFIILGIIQLVLSVSLVALGSLLLFREAALSTTGSGIWSGGIAAIAGALGVINVGRSRAGFLVASLICVASSTLAMALTGTGLIRDINAMEQNEDFNLMNAEAAVSAGCGLIFALALHFLISIISVYQSAIKLCSRRDETAQLLENIISANNSTMLNQHKVEEYFNSMSASEKEKVLSGENIDKLMAMWMYSAKRASPPQPPPVKKSRPIMLVPATAGNGLPPQMLPPGCRNPGILLPAAAAPPPPPPNVGFPFPSPYGATPPMPGSYRIIQPGSRPSSEIYAKHIVHSQRQNRTRQKRSSKMDANRRQRRKSDSDAENRKAFTYTGLDRTIADSFLERQEQSNNGSHVDYLTSTSSSNDSYRSGNIGKPV